VRRSFSVEAKRCENVAKNFSLRSEKNPCFRLFRFEAKRRKIEAKRKRTKRKKQTETKRNQKIAEINHKKAENLIDLKVLTSCQPLPPLPTHRMDIRVG
jgi:hypothetical protein